MLGPFDVHLDEHAGLERERQGKLHEIEGPNMLHCNIALANPAIDAPHQSVEAASFRETFAEEGHDVVVNPHGAKDNRDADTALRKVVLEVPQRIVVGFIGFECGGADGLLTSLKAFTKMEGEHRPHWRLSTKSVVQLSQLHTAVATQIQEDVDTFFDIEADTKLRKLVIARNRRIFPCQDNASCVDEKTLMTRWGKTDLYPVVAIATSKQHRQNMRHQQAAEESYQHVSKPRSLHPFIPQWLDYEG